MVHVLLLLSCAIAIYLACEWFVNAVEWLGARLRIGTLAVGTILAAVGTALPESVVTLVAVAFGKGSASDDIGVGAALGGPLVVGTIAYGVTGVMLIIRHRSRRMSTAGSRTTNPGATTSSAAPSSTTTSSAAPASTVATSDQGPTLDLLDGTDTRRLARDQTWFLGIFAFKIALGFVAFTIKPLLGLVFFAAYAVYFWRETVGSDDAAHGGDLEPLKLQPRSEQPTTMAVLAQTAGTLIVIFIASQLFVRQLEWAGPAMGLSPVVVALLLSPVATELPETMNAIIWVRQGKTPLALANISGAMMIQATVPSGIGLLGTPWRFDTPLLMAGIATTLSIGYLLMLLRTRSITPLRLALAAVFYLMFAVALVTTIN